MAGMEVEVKLRLPSAEAHVQVAALLKAGHEATLFQENIFLDGANKELSSNRVTFRVRFYNNDAKCVITVKGKATLVDGIGRAPEEEEQIEPEKGRAFVNDPDLLTTSDSPLISSLRQRTGCQRFVCLGGFRNVRNVFAWEGHKIELDETQFAFGTQYEIECETAEPEALKSKLEALLAMNNIPFSDSKSTKFATFRAGRFLD